MKIVPQSVTLEFITPFAIQLIERAGRCCYKSEGNITEDSAATFIRMLLARGHESVLEHAYASFRVITDRGISHEFVRHRLMSYSQESTRYCCYAKDKFGDEITVIEPPGLNVVQRGQWFTITKLCEQYYRDLTKLRLAPELARSVLPTCLKTEFVATANFREWRHFIKLRTSKAAHPQMREVAAMVVDLLVSHCPSVFEDLKVSI